MPRQFQTYPYKGQMLTCLQLSNLPHYKGTYGGIRSFIKNKGVDGLENFIDNHKGHKKRTVTYYNYKGKKYRACDIVKHKDCPHNDPNLFWQRHEVAKWSIKDALIIPIHTTRERFHTEKLNKKRGFKFNKEQIKKIMSIPVNPNKFVYLAIGQRIEKRNIENKGKSNE